MKDHDRGSYRDARRRQAKETAEALKDGKAEEMFFGASPTERKDLRQTKDKRAVDLNSLDLAPLDRGKFNAPEKVGENLRLIDMAMGNEPTPPTAPAQHPAAPKQTAQPVAKRKPKKKKQSLRARASSGRRRIMDSASKIPSWFRKDDFKPAPADSSEGVVVAKPRGRGLEILFWLGALGLIGAGFAGLAPAFDLPAETAFPIGLQAALTSQEGLIGLGVVCMCLGVDVRILRQPRGGLVIELLRSLTLAALPASLAAGLVFVAGLTPDPGFAPPQLLPALAPLEPHTTNLGLPLWGGVGAAVLLIGLLPALLARRQQPKL